MNHIIDGVILCLIVLILAISPDIRLAILKRVSMARFIHKVFVKLNKDNQNIYILGTINEEHLNNKRYSLTHIDGVIRNLHPDMLLVESRSEEVISDNLADGSIEMLFASLTARELDIPVGGFDWWNEDHIKPKYTNNIRKERMVENIINHSQQYNRVLILVEYSKIKELTSKLKEDGYHTSKIEGMERMNLLNPRMDKLEFPKDIKGYIKKRIELEKDASYLTKSEEWRNAYQDSIKHKMELLKKIEKIEEGNK